MLKSLILTCVPKHETPSHLPPHNISLGHPHAPAPSKAEEPEIKLPTSTGSSKKQESSRNTSISALLTMPKPLTVWITTNCGKILKEMGIPDHLPAS